MLEASSPPPPSLVPGLEEIQQGYELPLEERRVRGAPIRLFTFPHGTENASRTVVCLPGLGASGRSFAPLAPLAPDHRLLLWTPTLRTPLTYAPLQWNVEALAHPEARLPSRFALLGSSFGSLVALAFALKHPERVRALILVSPVPSVHRVRRWALSLSTLVRIPKPFAYLFAPTVARVLGGRYLPPEGRSEIVREARRISPVELLRRLRDILDADYLESLEHLRIPTLIIHGARDHVVPLSDACDVARRIPGARLEVLREASHLPYMSHPQAFNAFVDDFLWEHLADSPSTPL
ncbi:alpha/beta hydrolase [Stigmatella sp. ncwal1]|uniref:Alpha/beta hydrolase n=1 Tax=Stigmatella ashevillensis TaxID=2995309 RepID=A0ABT5DEU4_9BACT|nr:alpha/beta hydrolase [Stigmatella ashevillena]MDC0712162.1 alpha/beta hydrolase [Stigmatella ashevillena]